MLGPADPITYIIININGFLNDSTALFIVNVN
jgi:hypothetical protein